MACVTAGPSITFTNGQRIDPGLSLSVVNNNAAPFLLYSVIKLNGSAEVILQPTDTGFLSVPGNGGDGFGGPRPDGLNVIIKILGASSATFYANEAVLLRVILNANETSSTQSGQIITTYTTPFVFALLPATLNIASIKAGVAGIFSGDKQLPSIVSDFVQASKPTNLPGLTDTLATPSKYVFENPRDPNPQSTVQPYYTAPFFESVTYAGAWANTPTPTYPLVAQQSKRLYYALNVLIKNSTPRNLSVQLVPKSNCLLPCQAGTACPSDTDEHKWFVSYDVPPKYDHLFWLVLESSTPYSVPDANGNPQGLMVTPSVGVEIGFNLYFTPVLNKLIPGEPEVQPVKISALTLAELLSLATTPIVPQAYLDQNAVDIAPNTNQVVIDLANLPKWLQAKVEGDIFPSVTVPPSNPSPVVPSFTNVYVGAPTFSGAAPRLSANTTPILLNGATIPGMEVSPIGLTLFPQENVYQMLVSMKQKWGLNAVRIPLNQAFWLQPAQTAYSFDVTLPSADATTSVANYYRRLVKDLVNLARQAQFEHIVLSLEFTDAGNANAQVLQGNSWLCPDTWGSYDGVYGTIGHHQLPDTNSALFWASIASDNDYRYTGSAPYTNSDIIFELHAKPFPLQDPNVGKTGNPSTVTNVQYSSANYDTVWGAWANGAAAVVAEFPTDATCTPGAVQVSQGVLVGGNTDPTLPIAITTTGFVGLQTLFNIIRKSGANNIVIAPGIMNGMYLDGIVGKYLNSSFGSTVYALRQYGNVSAYAANVVFGVRFATSQFRRIEDGATLQPYCWVDNKATSTAVIDSVFGKNGANNQQWDLETASPKTPIWWWMFGQASQFVDVAFTTIVNDYDGSVSNLPSGQDASLFSCTSLIVRQMLGYANGLNVAYAQEVLPQTYAVSYLTNDSSTSYKFEFPGHIFAPNFSSTCSCVTACRGTVSQPLAGPCTTCKPNQLLQHITPVLAQLNTAPQSSLFTSVPSCMGSDFLYFLGGSSEINQYASITFPVLKIDITTGPPFEITVYCSSATAARTGQQVNLSGASGALAGLNSLQISPNADNTWYVYSIPTPSDTSIFILQQSGGTAPTTAPPAGTYTSGLGTFTLQKVSTGNGVLSLSSATIDASSNVTFVSPIPTQVHCGQAVAIVDAGTTLPSLSGIYIVKSSSVSTNGLQFQIYIPGSSARVGSVSTASLTVRLLTQRTLTTAGNISWQLQPGSTVTYTNANINYLWPVPPSCNAANQNGVNNPSQTFTYVAPTSP